MESGLTLVPIFAIIIAFVNFGLTIFKWTTLQNAVREGARYAITYQTQSGFGQDRSIANVVQSFSLGFVDASLTGTNQQIFVRYYSPTAAATPANQITNPPASGPAGNSSGNVVMVSVENINVGTWVSPIKMDIPAFKLNLYAADVMGSLPYGVSSVTR
jgi:Flp pilus assembly protein TadG